VHISELAQHHVENPREVVSQGDTVNVRILEVDAERRRLSLSLKRVEDGMPIQPAPGEEALPPSIDLSEAVFSDEPAAAASSVEAEEPALVDAEAEPEAPAEPETATEADVEPQAEAEAVPEADAEPEPEPEPDAPAAAEEAAEGVQPPAASADEPAEGSDETTPE
jgi:small subunit ribosomal protein S1